MHVVLVGGEVKLRHRSIWALDPAAHLLPCAVHESSVMLPSQLVLMLVLVLWAVQTGTGMRALDPAVCPSCDRCCCCCRR